MQNIFRLLSVFVCVLLLATSAMAFGDIRYPDRPLNLCRARSAKAEWVGSLYPGQKVRVAFMKDGWVAIFEPGETRASESAAVGFSNAKYLKAKQTRVEPESWGELVFTPRNLNIRARADIRGKRLDMLNAGDKVRIDFPDGDWTMVFSAKATIRSMMNGLGYCSAKYFQPVPKSSVASTAKAAPVVREVKEPKAESRVSKIVEAGSGQGQVSSAVAPPPDTLGKQSKDSAWGRTVAVGRTINLHQDRTSSSRLVRTLKPGETVRVDFLDKGWYAVFPENAVVRQEKRALGYALRSLIDGDDGSEVVPMSSAQVDKEPKQTAQATPRQAEAVTPKQAAETGRKTIVIDRSKFTGAKRADPSPNKTAHGYQYRLLEKSETKRYGESWITLKVFLSTKTLPGSDALRDFSTTLWKEHKRATKNLAVLIYLPGMDTEDLSFAVIQFDDAKLLELWVRKTTLFGTDFL